MKFVYVILVIISFTGCSKYVTDETFVFDYVDISIPNVDSIYSVSFPSNQIGFVVTNLGLFKTVDRGESWELSLMVNKGDVHFSSNQLGVVSPRYYTEDGGDTWVDVGYNSDGLAITESNDLISMTRENYTTLSFWKKEAGNANFNFYSLFYVTGSNTPKKFRCYGEYLYVFQKDNENNIFAIHTTDQSKYFSIIEGANHSTDLVATFNQIYLSGTSGEVSSGVVPDNQFAYVERKYFLHTNNYYAIDYYDDHIIAVGKNTIVTNKQSKYNSNVYNEVYDVSQNGLNDTFYLIDMIDENNVVIVAYGTKILIGTI